MSAPLFRRDSVDQLVSVEALDQAPQSILLRAKLLIACCIILFVSGGLFSVLVSVPVKVSAEGIIWTPQGIREVAVNSAGLIKHVNLGRSDLVEQDQVIAVIDQTDLRMERDSLQRELQAITLYIEQLNQLNNQDKSIRSEFDQKVADILDTSRQRYKEQEKRLADREKVLERSNRQGLLETERVNQMLNDLTTTKERLSSISRDRANQVRQNLQSDIQVNKALLTTERERSQINEKLRQLDSKILNQGEVTSPFAGRIVQVDVDPGDYVSPGKTIAMIQPGDDQHYLRALVYVNYSDGAKVQEGMAVELEISAYPKDKYGVVTGKVTKVSQLPSSIDSLMRQLKNDQLVKRLAGDGAPYEIQIQLDESDEDVSGYHWSTVTSADRHLHSGIMTRAHIIVRQKKLYKLMSPEPF